mmetsp:Transcript_12424/g.30004  ORF Transcript_12424/g.30004 Transcript_12424/m.30004 type:complete len:171 (+) Transcript_12424:162-674(+)|eukprot:CAMPEP_0197591002 /NCGR_PEP_ID=MMETSP1326-20131121/12503_1 /TAXON_ID=1155430 /ORGANISM="Genus nov. species nov., Strain RCC2288" /LENGTH=170 /DNA_ID=CAMNT_0043156331 /DNA_START=101 /DNA_END=613 /DNA_ORIENTATION=+
MAALMGFSTGVACAGLSARSSTLVSGSRVVAMPQGASAPARFSFSVEAAHKKGTGSTKNGRDSNPQYLGVKKYGEEAVVTGNIIVRQRGNSFHAGPGVGQGKDFTLYALRDGEVLFKIGANKKQFVRVVDAVDRSGREDGKPTRREKKLKLYTPRAQLRAEAEAVAASSR